VRRYNYEPLNFFRGATSLVCASFAGFELLAFRSYFEDGHDALATWAAVAAGICVSYLVMMAVRWRVFAKSKAEAIKRRARTLTARP
jgi:putative flippase GtrA